MDLDQVIAHFGTQEKAAAALDMTQGSISAWRKSGIPVPRQFQIEVLTDGALKADRSAQQRENVA